MSILVKCSLNNRGEHIIKHHVFISKKYFQTHTIHKLLTLLMYKKHIEEATKKSY
jgi:hypothetical protein